MQKIKVFVILFLLFSVLFFILDKQFMNSVPVSKAKSLMAPTPSITVLNETDLAVREASQRYFDESLQRSRFNGAILIARNGKIVFEEYSGLKDVLKGDPIDSITSFHLASVSKTFTAMAILKLWENRQLKLEDTVSDWLKGFPFSGVTIRDLLSHRSGLPNYVHFVEKLGWDTEKFLTNQDLLDLMIQYPGKLKPGRPNANFDYCNTNYALLALIVEKVTKTSFANFMDSTFFKPLGMTHSFVFDMTQADQVLQSYKFNNRKEPMMFLDAVYGDKNIYSTPRDMMKWDWALIPGNIFSKETLDQAFRGYSYERRGIRNYGLGWRLYEMPSGKKIIYHNGWWHGNNTVFSRLPSDSTVIIVLGNKFNRSIYQAKRIAGVFSGYGIQLNEDD